MDGGGTHHPSPGAPGKAEAALLNGPQRNSLSIALRLVEEALREVARLLDEAPFEEEMHGMADDLTPEQRQAIADEVCRASEMIRGLRARFTLAPEIHPKSRVIAGKTMHLWEMVMDARARRLRAYGDVAPGLAEILDPSMEQLGTIVRRIDALARHRADAHGRPGGRDAS